MQKRDSVVTSLEPQSDTIEVSVRFTPVTLWIFCTTSSPSVVTSDASAIAIMSCGPVTACATETPPTWRSLAATSRALPGDVSMRMNAFTAMSVYLHGARGRRAGAQCGGGIGFPLSSYL